MFLAIPKIIMLVLLPLPMEIIGHQYVDESHEICLRPRNALGSAVFKESDTLLAWICTNGAARLFTMAVITWQEWSNQSCLML
jgi:hypothetical protein